MSPVIVLPVGEYFDQRGLFRLQRRAVGRDQFPLVRG